MNINNLLKYTEQKINTSDLDASLKKWFNNNILNKITKDSGLDWSGELGNTDITVEYYVLTKDDDNDYRIVFSDDLNKFGLESRGTVTSNDKYNGQFIKFIIYWTDSPVEVIKNI